MLYKVDSTLDGFSLEDEINPDCTDKLMASLSDLFFISVYLNSILQTIIAISFTQHGDLHKVMWLF